MDTPPNALRAFDLTHLWAQGDAIGHGVALRCC